MSGSKLDSVFYAKSYHPIQAGSIDGTDISPHDNAVYRALLCSSAGLYDPFGDPKVIGDPYCTIFVGRLSHLTTEETLRKAISKYGRVKNLRLVRDIVTGASRGYAFVEYETEREMWRAYKEAHHSMIDDCKIIVDYNRQQLMPGWIPRRLGGGLGGKKESGQLRFGGRERPFRAPLQPIPFDELKKLGIPPPPEGRYMSLYQDPSPPRRARSSVDREEHTRSSMGTDRYHRRNSKDREDRSHDRSFVEKEERNQKRSSVDREDHYRDRSYSEREEHYRKRNSRDREERSHKRKTQEDREESSRKRKSRTDRDEYSHERNSRDREERSHERNSRDCEERSSKHRKHSSKSSHQHERKSPDQFSDF